MQIPRATLLSPTPPFVDGQLTLGPMTKTQSKLCVRLKQLGFKLGNPMKLYGERYELLGDPIVSGDNLALVSVVDKKSGQLRSLRIPLLVVNMAMESVAAREQIEKTTPRAAARSPHTLSNWEERYLAHPEKNGGRPLGIR